MFEINNIQEFVFKSDEKIRIDIFLSQKTDLSRNTIQKLIEKELIKVNNKVVKSSYKLEFNDKITILDNYFECENTSKPNIDFELDIIFEDENYLIINKNRGVVVHPCNTTKSATLVDALRDANIPLSDCNGDDRPGVVHRIDKNTTGLLIIVKNNKAHLFIQEQIKTKKAQRIYIGLVDSNIKEDSGVIDKAIGRDRKNRKTMSVKNGLRNAVTEYKVLERFKQYTLVEFYLKTGRTHQIRAHMKSINHPITGDKEYGGSNKYKLQGQLLHAYKLIFISPTTNKEVEYFAPLPNDFENVLEKLRKR